MVDAQSSFLLIDKFKHDKVYAQDVRDLFALAISLSFLIYRSLFCFVQIASYCREFNYELTRKELDLLLGRLDKNKDQKVTLDEFLYEMQVKEEEEEAA